MMACHHLAVVGGCLIATVCLCHSEADEERMHQVAQATTRTGTYRTWYMEDYYIGLPDWQASVRPESCRTTDEPVDLLGLQQRCLAHAERRGQDAARAGAADDVEHLVDGPPCALLELRRAVRLSARMQWSNAKVR